METRNAPSARPAFTLTAPGRRVLVEGEDQATEWLLFFDAEAKLLGETSCDGGRVRLFGGRCATCPA